MKTPLQQDSPSRSAAIMAGKYSPRHGLRELGWPAKLVGALVALVLVAVLLRGPTLLGGCEQSRPLFPGCAEPCNLGNAAAAAEAMTKAWPSHTDTPGMVIKE